MGNNPAGHFFMSDLKSVGALFQGFGSAVGDTLTGLTGGGFDYSSTIQHYKNFGEDYRNMFTGRTDTTGSSLTPEQQALQNHNRSIDPNANWNTANWQARSATQAANPSYSAQAGNTSTKPSDLMKISDPTTKLGMAQSRGVVRQAITAAGNQMDTKLAPQIMSGSATTTPASSAPPTQP